MKKIFEVKETFHDYRLVHLATGLGAALGDGVDQFVDEGFDEFVGMTPARNSFPEIGTEEFREQWEREVNTYAHIYFEAYYPKLDDLVVFDNEGETLDRYTVVTERASPLECSVHDEEGLWVCLGLSRNPGHPQGFSQWGHCVLPNNRLGERIHFLDLPAGVQKHVAERLEENEDE